MTHLNESFLAKFGHHKAIYIAININSYCYKTLQISYDKKENEKRLRRWDNFIPNLNLSVRFLFSFQLFASNTIYKDSDYYHVNCQLVLFYFKHIYGGYWMSANIEIFLTLWNEMKFDSHQNKIGNNLSNEWPYYLFNFSTVLTKKAKHSYFEL